MLLVSLQSAHWARSGAVCITLLSAMTGALGADQIVSYNLYDDPNAQNPVLEWRIVLELEETNSSAASIGYTILSVVVIEVNQAPTANRRWTDSAPSVDTADGLWWVKHDDLNDPLVGEFTMPPFVEGTADAESASDPNMDYDFEGIANGPVPPFDPTQGLSYTFFPIGDLWPIAEDDDEPAEIEGFDQIPL